MFTLSRTIIFSLIFCTLPLSLSYAQENKAESADEEKILSLDEARELIFQASSAEDAIAGTVATDKEFEYYDIHARKNAYRENTKEFAASIKQRQIDFDAPRVAAVQANVLRIEQISKAESTDYNKIEEEDTQNLEDSEDANEDNIENKAPLEEDDNKEIGKTLVEKSVPSKEGDTTNKKVIISDDSPDFDASNL